MFTFLASRLGGWAVGAIACMVVLIYALWLRGELHAQARELDAETRRANVATEAAAHNAGKVVEIKQLMLTAQLRQKERAASHAAALAERDDEIANMRKMKDKWYEYLDNHQDIAARAWRRDFNRLQRTLAESTCRTDCEGGNSENPD